MTTVFLGIGSNINAEQNMCSAASLLRATWPNIQFSSVYETAPREVEDQPIFLNAVAKFMTDESIEEVHKRTMAIEQALKKAPPFRFGPRTIDIDILLYDEEKIHTNMLTVPHPRMLERRFVLEPLAELIDPNTLYPGSLTSWNVLFEAVKDQKCLRTNIKL